MYAISSLSKPSKYYHLLVEPIFYHLFENSFINAGIHVVQAPLIPNPTSALNEVRKVKKFITKLSVVLATNHCGIVKRHAPFGGDTVAP